MNDRPRGKIWPTNCLDFQGLFLPNAPWSGYDPVICPKLQPLNVKARDLLYVSLRTFDANTAGHWQQRLILAYIEFAVFCRLFKFNAENVCYRKATGHKHDTAQSAEDSSLSVIESVSYVWLCSLSFLLFLSLACFCIVFFYFHTCCVWNKLPVCMYMYAYKQ